MGIAASKVVCYTAFGGIDPAAALPVCIDAGVGPKTQKDSRVCALSFS